MRKENSNQFQLDPKWKWLEFFLGFKYAINLYSPFIGSGIRVINYDKENHQIDVRLKMNFFNRGYMGTHFGGSIYSMCDPFYVYLLIKRLGNLYMIWDKHAEIDYIKQNKESVFAKFEVTDSDIENIKFLLTKQRKTNYTFSTNIVDSQGGIIASVKKNIYIRKMETNTKNKKSEY